MIDYEISYALECTPLSDRARLTKILDGMDEADRIRVNDMVGHHIRRFNPHRRETPWSAGQVAYEALVLAIKSVRTDGTWR
jgi:hypothetical protein